MTCRSKLCLKGVRLHVHQREGNSGVDGYERVENISFECLKGSFMKNFGKMHLMVISF